MNATRAATLALLICSAVRIDAEPTPKRPTAAELRSWAEGSCVRAGRQAGIDYAHELDRAIAGDPKALATLFRFTDSGWFDGAAAEGHVAILFGLLQRWGDRPFAHVLRAQKTPVRKAVFGAVTTFPYFKPAEFPLTNASAPH